MVCVEQWSCETSTEKFNVLLYDVYDYFVGDEEDSEDDDVVDPGARRGHSTAGLASDDDDEGVIDEDRRAQPK